MRHPLNPLAITAGAASCLIGLAGVSRPAMAQERNLPRAHGFEVTAGLTWEAASDLGDSAARLTAPSGPPLTLFNTSAGVEPATGVDVRIAFNVIRAIALEARFSRTQPELTVQVRGDLEGVPAATVVSDAYRLYHVDGNLVVHLLNAVPGTRAAPYVFAGAGHARRLNGGSVLLGTGTTIQAGGGVKYFFAWRPSGFFRGAGIRGEGQWRRHPPAVDLFEEARITFSATLGGILAF